MEEALRFFRTYEVWVYLLLGFGGLIYVRKFFLAWHELQGAAFGLERENAQARLNQSASLLVLLMAMAMTEFALVSFVAPAVPGAMPILTPTLDLLATPTITLQPTTEVGNVPTTETQVPNLQASDTGCVSEQIIITSPEDGDEIGGVVEIMGTVDVLNFGFYKLELKHPEETNWLTILAGNEEKLESNLGSWNTSLMTPGLYQLSLVVTDNEGQSFAPCTIQVHVTSPADTPPQ